MKTDSSNAPSQALPEMSDLWQQTLHWQPSDTQQLRFQQLYQQILAGNLQLNLTRITTPEEFWEKHLWDSLRGIQQFLEPAEHPELEAADPTHHSSRSASPSLKVIDIGTGGGFPGIPIAIAHPTWHVTLLDSTRKKMQFVDQVLTDLKISNATTLVDRVEQIGQTRIYRQSFDIALIRAVATASVCAEYALPLVKTGGLAILYRGQWALEETIALESVATQLGATVETVEAFTTPLTQSVRHCLYLRKIAATPAAFPRPTGVPGQQPLS